MSTQDEEFEFRLRAEREAAMAPTTVAKQPAPRGAYQRGDLVEGTRRDLKMDWGKTLSDAAYAVGGRVTDAVASGGFPNAAPYAGMATNMAVEGLPGMFGAGAAKVGEGMQGAGTWLMRNAIRPTLEDQKSGKAAIAVKTMLDEGINPTRGGMEKLRAKVEGISDEVANLLKQYPNATVNKQQVANTLQPVIAKIEASNPTPNAARKAVEDIYDEFLTNGVIPNNMPVMQAQKLKQGIYQAIGDRKYSLAPYSVTEQAAVSGNKGLGTGFREGIEAAVPEVGPLNALQSPLITAKNVAERRALQEGNKSLSGLLPLTHGPVGAVAMALDHYTLLKSLLARGLYQGGQLGGDYSRNAVGGMLATQPLFGALSEERK